MSARDFNGQGWKAARDEWSVSVQKTRAVALADIEARRAWVPADLASAWEALAPLLDQIEYRAIPRETDIWRRTCASITELRRHAVAAEETRVAAALDELMTTAVLFAQQCVKDGSPI